MCRDTHPFTCQDCFKSFQFPCPCECHPPVELHSIQCEHNGGSMKCLEEKKKPSQQVKDFVDEVEAQYGKDLSMLPFNMIKGMLKILDEHAAEIERLKEKL